MANVRALEKPEFWKCLKCGEIKKFTKENFVGSAVSKWGLTSKCKECKKLQSKYAKKHPNVIETFTNETCIHCKEVKPFTLEYFCKCTSSPNGLRKLCKSCRQLELSGNRHTNKITKNSKYLAYKHSAIKRNLPFELTKEEFTTFWQVKCFYCLNSIENVGIDRVNNLEGYTLENCIPCCYFCNIAKFKHTKEEFFTMIKKIYENHNLQTFKLVEV